MRDLALTILYRKDKIGSKIISRNISILIDFFVIEEKYRN